MQEFAPGIPSNREVAELPEATGLSWNVAVQHHNADKAGPHWDLRLVDPETGKAHSWAVPKKQWPTAEKKNILAVQQPTHTSEYSSWSGDIPKGTYGAGKVENILHAPSEVTSTKDKVVFTVPDVGKLRLLRTKDKQWLLQKVSEYTHPEQRVLERTKLKPSIVKKLQKLLTKSNLPAFGQVGHVQLGSEGFAVVKTKPKVDFPILATVLGPNSRPPGKNLTPQLKLEKLKNLIETHKKTAEYSREEALALAQTGLEKLKDHIDSGLVAGSLARGHDSVRDVDLLVVPKSDSLPKLESPYNVFTTSKEDLEPAVMQWLSGKAIIHNKRKAKELGHLLNRYGLWLGGKDKNNPIRSAEEIYKILEQPMPTHIQEALSGKQKLSHTIKQAEDYRRRAMLFLYDDNGRVLATRTGNNNWVFPAGGIDPGEGINSAAKRETLEEAGYSTGGRLHAVGARADLTTWPEFFAEESKKRGRNFLGDKTYFRAAPIGPKDDSLLGADGNAFDKLELVPVKQLLKDLQATASDPNNKYAPFDKTKLKGIKALAAKLEEKKASADFRTSSYLASSSMTPGEDTSTAEDANSWTVSETPTWSYTPDTNQKDRKLHADFASKNKLASLLFRR